MTIRSNNPRILIENTQQDPQDNEPDQEDDDHDLQEYDQQDEEDHADYRKHWQIQTSNMRRDQAVRIENEAQFRSDLRQVISSIPMNEMGEVVRIQSMTEEGTDLFVSVTSSSFIDDLIEHVVWWTTSKGKSDLFIDFDHLNEEYSPHFIYVYYD